MLSIEEAKAIIAKLGEAKEVLAKETINSKQDAIRIVAEKLKLANKLIEECAVISKDNDMLFFFNDKKMVLKPNFRWQSSQTCWDNGQDIDNEHDSWNDDWKQDAWSSSSC